MISRQGRFLICHKKQDNDFINEFDWLGLEKKYQEMKFFYSFENDLQTIRIHFNYLPEEFAFFSGKEKYESWMSATVEYHNTINMFSPSVIELFTNHKVGSIFGTIVHEISHLIYGYSGLPEMSLWMEGIAEYHRCPKCKNKIDFNLPTLISMNPQYDYGVGHLLICSIMNYFPKYGNKKILEFLNRCDKLKISNQEVENVFLEIFEINHNILINQKEVFNQNGNPRV